MSEEEMAMVKAELRTLQKQIDSASSDIKALLTAEAERRGREQRDERSSDFQHDDRWQVWLRAFFPVAFITAIINAVIWIFTGDINGGGK